jgi:rhamnosyl/mannosyltransferase
MKIPDLHLYEYPTFNLRRPYSIATFPQVLMHRYLVRLYVDEFVAPSEHMASWIRSELDPKSPVSVIRNPSIIEPIDTVPAPDVNRVLFVGRLDGKKGVDHLISAFDDESLQDTAITLDIVGDGSAKPALEALVGERDLGATVTFHGRVSHEKIAPYYRRASVFVLPAVIEENAPLTIPEAMSQGTPVVTTNIGGQQELVEDGETGLLVEPEDSTAIAQAIRTIVDDEGRLLSMASAAHRRACELSLDAHASEIEEELTKLVERDQSPTKRLPESGAE